MEAKKQRLLKSGKEYDALFPPAEVGTVTIKTDAGVGDTVAFIPKVVRDTLHQTKAIAEHLRGSNTYETCRNIWHFVYGHIAYRKDKDGYEQIRAPSRVWHDRRAGVDCDCYTTFISSILTNLRIPHKLRITKYNHDYFQHIYPVVPHQGRLITVDCVTDQFDYEVPYSEKKDYNMDLQFLNGIGDLGDADYFNGMDGDDMGVGELGLFGRRKHRHNNDSGSGDPNDPNAVPGSGVKKKGFFKKLLNVANKANPATFLLRNGVLASMKLNIGNIGKRLRWSYLSPNQAAAKGIDAAKFEHLVKIRQKLENIFYGAGGNPENMRAAVLHGKGNKDHAVAGLSGLFGMYGLGMTEYGSAYTGDISIITPLPQLLGATMWAEEGTSGLDGLGELGEPVTLATVTAASGVIAAIAGLLKKCGDIFKNKGTAGSEDFNDATNAAAEGEIPAQNPENGSSTQVMKVDGQALDTKTLAPNDAGGSSTSLAPAGDGGSAPTGENFWDKNKKWLVPAGIGAGGLTLLAVAMTSHKTGGVPTGRAMHGVPRRRSPKRTPSKRKATHHKIEKVKF